MDTVVVQFVNTSSKEWFWIEFLNVGYGIEIMPFRYGFIGINVSLGGFTFSEKSEIPYKAIKKIILRYNAKKLYYFCLRIN